MSEDVARAVGAKSPMEVKIAGKVCKVRPLGLRELTEIQMECLEWYKRQYIKTYVDSADMFPDGMEEARKAREEAAKWDVDDLPRKSAYDPKTMVATDKLRRWVMAEYDLGKTRQDAKKVDEDKIKRMAVAALDRKSLSVEKYKELTGNDARSVPIAYDSWWVTGCMDGMVSFVHKCFEGTVTRQEVLDEVSKNSSLMSEVQVEIERLSTPSMGNG